MKGRGFHIKQSPSLNSICYLISIKYCLTPVGSDNVILLNHNWRGDVIGICSGSGVLTAKYEYDTWGQRVKKTVRRTVFSDERHNRYRAAGGVAVAVVRARLPTRTT